VAIIGNPYLILVSTGPAGYPPKGGELFLILTR
jgi:hypothetical protein